MATIHDLNTSILEMPDEEGFELIKSIRFERRQVPKKRSRTSSKKPAKQRSVKSLLSGLDEDARLKLIAELEGN